ncbi:MAG: hypothetical protein E2O42_09675 [Nitrospina sp.]|nr:MAG: hypothetical protein E2O42_09675 [Nitrospina sp.]
MKIVCPKCQAAYRVDLPDPDEVSVEVQCGKCLSIFLFTPDIEQSITSVNQGGIPGQTARASDLTENRPAKAIVPPQKDGEQEVSGQKDPASSSRKQASASPETPEELAMELFPGDPEALEIIIDEEPPDDPLEEQVLDEIWNRAVAEGTREERKTPKKSPAPRADTPEQQDQTPTWEEAFADQVQVENKWRQEQEKARIRDEQQLAEALGVPYTPPESTLIQEPVTQPPMENRQEWVDRCFAEARAKIDPQKRKRLRQRVKRLPTMEDQRRAAGQPGTQKPARKDAPQKAPTPPKKSPPLPSLEERQRDIDTIIDRHRALQKESEKTGKQEESLPLPSMDERQREIDEFIRSQRAPQQAPQSKAPEEPSTPVPSLEDRHRNVDEIVTREQIRITQEDTLQETPPEEVTLDQEEAMPSWEEAFADQAEVEAVWKKSKEQDRIQEEQQLAEALGEEYVPTEPAPETDQKQGEVDQIFVEAKARVEKEKTREDIDLEEEVTIDQEEAIPSWEEAFAHQAEVEAGWRKAKERDRIQEEQQLAEALGEEYIPPEPAADQTPAVAENPQAIVDDIFAQMKSQDQLTDQPPAKETPASPTTDAGTAAEEEYEPTWTDAFADQSKIEATWAKPEEQETSGEAASASEKKDTTLFDQTLSGDIDLTADLVDMDMKQLVEQAFKEEMESDPTAEAPVSKKVETPTAGEAAPEPELTQEVEAPPETPAAGPTAPVSPDEEQDIAPIIDHHASDVDPSATPEAEPIPELTLESAEENPTVPEPEPAEAASQPEPELELEVTPEPAETPAPVEAQAESVPDLEPIPEHLDEVADALEMELAQEPAMAETPAEPEAVEPPTAEAATPAEPEAELTEEPSAVSAKTESLKDEEEEYRDEELWAELFPEQNEEGQPAAKTAKSTPVATEEPFGGSDFWDQVLEKEPGEPEPAAPAPAAAPPAQKPPERETLSDEELWAQAFPEDEEIAPVAAEPAGGRPTADSSSKLPPVVAQTNVRPGKDLDDDYELDEAAYADDEDDYEFERRPRKLGPFTIPRGRRGDMVVGGAVMVFLLLAGSVYFTLQTFVPGDLTDIQTAETEVPEGLTPSEAPPDNLTGDLMTAPKPPGQETTPPVDTPGDQGDAILSDPAKILEEFPEEKGILKDLAESQILKDIGKTQAAQVEQSSLLASGATFVTLSTIMPVAYNPTDIRVLSFSVEMQLSDAQSAKQMRESLPVYEEIMTQTVEEFLSRKFYNDILYVKENLQKRLQTAMNQSLKNGHVKKTKFVDFAIQ